MALETVVLLSDNAFKRKLAKLALQALGARVIEAGAPHAALRAAVAESDGACGAVVVALREWERDGLQAARALREALDSSFPNDEPPALALVADRRDDGLRDAAAEAGVDFTLIEPVDWGAFLTRLAEDRAEAEEEAEAARRAAEAEADADAAAADAAAADPSLAPSALFAADHADAQEASDAPPPFDLVDPADSDSAAPLDLEAAGGLGPTRFFWRPVDGAFACGVDAAAALGASARPTPERLDDWTAACVAPRADIIRAALTAAAEETGETLLVGSFERPGVRGAPERGHFALFAERRTDARGAVTIVGAAHRASALSSEAVRDADTGLLTRDSLRAPLAAMLRRAADERRKCAAFAVELVDFFEVDESLGVEAGDHAVRATAERLRETLRGGDLIARSGRAAFLVAQPEVKSLDDVRALAARLIAALSEPIDLFGEETRLSVAVGAAIGPDHAESAGALAAAAETALREAARAGGGRAQLYGGLSARPAQERGALRRDVLTAIGAGTFELHYLPAVGPSGATTSLEALLRLRRGEIQIAPEDVVDIAEDGGDIAAFTRRVFEMAAEDFALWLKAVGPGARLALNVTGAALAAGDAAVAARAAFEAVGAGPESVRFEITDKRLERRRAEAVAALSAAKEAGVEIALDDFGSRASSIDALGMFPYDRAKLARTLVGPDRRRGGADLAAATARLARDAGVRLTVPGVANRDLKARAFKLGADEVQGYAIAPPAPMRDLVGWFGRERSAG